VSEPSPAGSVPMRRRFQPRLPQPVAPTCRRDEHSSGQLDELLEEPQSVLVAGRAHGKR
jgi:hypothetical protein